ncbi:MAG TPA: type II secretion system F family protein [Rubrivivax sp.]|nr:type II secretion system F family protein [Rubrivivax sp.]
MPASRRRRAPGRHLLEAQGEIRRGRALSAILAEQGWIAPTRLNLIRAGERAGELPRMLAQLGSMHTQAAREQMRRLLTLIEPRDAGCVL